jgi:hypothetical protein
MLKLERKQEGGKKKFQPERAKRMKTKMRSLGLPFISDETGKIFLNGS